MWAYETAQIHVASSGFDDGRQLHDLGSTPKNLDLQKKTALIWPMILSHHSVSTCQMTKDEKDQSRSLWKHHHRGCLRLYKAISTAVFRGGQGFKMSPVTRPLCSRQTGPTRPKR